MEEEEEEEQAAVSLHDSEATVSPAVQDPGQSFSQSRHIDSSIHGLVLILL